MLDIKAICKLHLQNTKNEVTDFLSLKQVLLDEVDKLRKNDKLKDKTIEIKAEMEWLRARNRLSEIALALAIISVVLCIITSVLSMYVERYGEWYLKLAIFTMVVLAVISAGIFVGELRTHMRECNSLAYYTIMLELIQAETDKEDPEKAISRN